MRFFLLSELVFLNKFFHLKMGILALVLTMFTPVLLLAEGSKDFRNYPGKRLWLDTRDNQQLKVYAAEGEFINVGASHTGVAGGFIAVYTPAGVLDTIFDNNGADVGFGAIEDDVEEINGPTGGGTLNGDGYIPGVIQVPAGMGGIWTIQMAFPQYQIAAYTQLDNDQPWNRDQHQNISVRVILAWDITVSQNAAANDGGNMLTGRVYSNEYISIINGNGNSTSPQFIVLSRDGFQYLVNFMETDPFRFPISSNSLGLVTNDFAPIYKSEEETDFVRSADPNSWIPGGTYLYEPQAQDFGSIVNNKIFFSPPDPNMPSMALTTDIFANTDDMDPSNDGNTHQTWLFNNAESLELDTLHFEGADPDGFGCESPFIEIGEGGYFIFGLNINGFATLELDLNNNQIYDDSVDVTLTGNLNSGTDSLFWNGIDGLGNVFGTVGDTLTIGYRGFIRFGEIHIANTDVENNDGGVVFDLLNAPPNIPSDIFYYDHSDLTNAPNAVSGGGMPGNALPTTTPFTYSGNFGNDNYLDQWVFSDFIIMPVVTDLIIVEDCNCTVDDTPVIEAVTSTVAICQGEDAVLQAYNTIGTVPTVIYTWNGPNGFFFTETINGSDTSTVNIAQATTLFAGDYTVNATTPDGCDADPITITLTVGLVPDIVPTAANFAACAGDDLTISATSMSQILGDVNYNWVGPNFMFSGTTTIGGNFDATITGIDASQAGTYTLTVETAAGCVGMASVDVAVNANPVLVDVGGGGDFCGGDGTILTVTNTETNINEITFTWNGPNGFFATLTTMDVTTPYMVTISNMDANNAGDYTLSVSTDAGCTADDQIITINVNSEPSIANIMGDAVCVGDDLFLTANNDAAGTGDLTYTWTGPNFSYTATVGENDPMTATLTGATLADAGTYTLSVESAGGCSNTASVDVTINPNPVLIDLGGGGAFCEGDPTVLTATNTETGINQITYTWMGPNGFFFTGTTFDVTAPLAVTISSLALDNTGTYTLTVETDAGCATADQTVEITVNPNPTIINIMGDEVCEGEDLFLTASNAIPGVDSITYTWTGPNFSYTATVGENDPMTATVAGATTANSGTYTISVVSLDGCVGLDQTVEGTVFDNPEITDLTPSQSVCEGGSIILTGSNSGTGMTDITYTWTGPNGILDQQTTQNVAGPFEFMLSNLTPADAGDYILCLESDQGCGPICDTVMIDVNEGLNIINLTGAGDYCEGDDITLSAENDVIGGITTITFTWTLPDGSMVTGTAPPAGPFVLNIPNSTVDDSGTYLLDLVSDAGCISMQASFEVTVNVNPVLSNITGGGGYCTGENVTLSSNNTVPGLGVLAFTWTLPDGSMVTGTVADMNPIELDLNNIQMDDAGTYTLFVITPEGCSSDTLSTELTINEMPMTSNVTPDTIICESESLTLSATNTSGVTSTYAWTGPNGYNASGNAGPGQTFTEIIDPIESFGAGDYILILTSGEGCESEPDTVAVEISPQPILSPVSGGGFYCEGDTAVIQVVNTNPLVDSLFYTCILPDGSVNVVLMGGMDTFTIVIPDLDAMSGGFVFCAAETLDSCGADLVSTEIIIQPTPEISDISGGGPYCAGDIAMLNAGNIIPGTGTITYTWTGPNGFSETNTAPFEGPFPLNIPNITVDQAGEYCLNLLTDAGCAAMEACVEIVVNPTPELSPMDGGGDYCVGDTVTLSTMNMTDGMETDTLFYVCTDPAGNEITGFVIGNEPIVLVIEGVTMDDAGTYSCVVTSEDGCESNTSTANVTVNATPVIEDIDGGGPYCEGETVTLTATNNVSGTGMITYTWLNPDGSVLFTGTAGENGPFDASIPNVGTDAAGEYCLLLESAGGCGSDQQCVTIVVNPLPIIGAFDGGGEYCEGDVPTISASIEMNGAASIDWQITGPDGFDQSGTVTMDETVSFDIIVSEATAGTYTLTLVTDEGCEATQSLTISITSVPLPILEASTDALCPGDELQLVVTNAGDFVGQVVEFSWFQDQTLLATTTDGMFLIPNATGGVYSVIVTVDGCAENSMQIEVPLFQTPTAVDDAATTDINTPVDGNVITNDNPGGGTIIVESNTNPANGTVVVNEDGTFTYTPNENFVGEDSFQYTICSVECPTECSTANVIITVEVDDLIIPNVITPNGDGDNDLFVIPGIELFGDNELRIFNRWGDEIYAAKPYRNDWDGTFEDKPLPSSTYFILLELGDGSDPIAQFLTIVR